MVRLSWIALTLLFASSCTVDDLKLDQRFCDPEYPCATGYSCIQQQCVKQDGDGAPADSSAGRDSDGPAPDHGRPAEGGPPDSSPNDAPDLAPTDLFQGDISCPPSTTACSGSCVDTQTDVSHCGGCNVACGPESDRCQDGKCHCGDKQPICTNGLSCQSGACACVAGVGSLCSGCCTSATQCAPGTSTAACGQQPNMCVVCSSTDPCKVPVCDATSRTCDLAPRADGFSCVLSSKSGRCQQGSCCTGCWNSSTSACLPGTSTAACGVSGLSCKKCLSGYSCVSGNCVMP
jgi:hypothetical protein